MDRRNGQVSALDFPDLNRLKPNVRADVGAVSEPVVGLGSVNDVVFEECGLSREILVRESSANLNGFEIVNKNMTTE